MRSPKDKKGRRRICHTRGQAQTPAVSPPDVGGSADHPDRASCVATQGLLLHLSPGPAQPFPASRDVLGDTGPWPAKLDLSCPHTPSLSQKGKPSQGACFAHPLCSWTPGVKPHPLHRGEICIM